MKLFKTKTVVTEEKIWRFRNIVASFIRKVRIGSLLHITVRERQLSHDVTENARYIYSFSLKYTLQYRLKRMYISLPLTGVISCFVLNYHHWPISLSATNIYKILTVSYYIGVNRLSVSFHGVKSWRTQPDNFVEIRRCISRTECYFVFTAVKYKDDEPKPGVPN